MVYELFNPYLYDMIYRTRIIYVQQAWEVRGSMKISTKGRYAVRVMLDLAVHNTGEYIKVKQIAQRQEISEKYLEQIIGVLNKAGYVKSARGAQGGYRIAGNAADYTIGMVLRLTEGSLCPVACLEDEVNECARCDTCETLGIWKELNEAINNVVDHVTIGDLAERQMIRENAMNYSI